MMLSVCGEANFAYLRCHASGITAAPKVQTRLQRDLPPQLSSSSILPQSCVFTDLLCGRLNICILRIE
jgi:hypothetical protein